MPCVIGAEDSATRGFRGMIAAHSPMARTSVPQDTSPTSPTAALDRALQSLAQNDPEWCLRHAVPTLEDQGAGASAFDLIGRAAVALGSMHLARTAFTAAARSLAREGVAAHAVAAALSVQRLSGSNELLSELATVFGADAPRDARAPVKPPPLRSLPVSPLAAEHPRAELLKLAQAAVEKAAVGTDAPLEPHPPHGLWGALPTATFVRFARGLDVRLYPAETRVLTEGSHGRSLFVIARGEARVTRGTGDTAVPLAALGSEAVFGELALLTAEARVATVTTARAAIVLEAPREAIEAAIADVPELGEALAGFGRRRLIENLRRTSPLLRGVPAEEREALANRFETLNFTSGETILTQGDAALGLFLVVSGRVEVVRAETERESLLVASLGAGGCFGEVSLVLRRPASASVRATRDTTALVLRPDAFMEIVKAYPDLLATLYELAVAREQELLSIVAQEATEADDLVIL